MRDKVMILDDLIATYPALSVSRDSIERAFDLLLEGFATGSKLLLCGNGGSAADCAHIVGELTKSFLLSRHIGTDLVLALNNYGKDGAHLAHVLQGGLPAVCLTDNAPSLTAYINDCCADAVFAQQVNAIGGSRDMLMTLSTSGNSANCVLAAITAKAKGMRVVALTGEHESKLSDIADVTIRVPRSETYLVQELHLPVYHALCAMLEQAFWG